MMINIQLLDKRIDESGYRIGFITDKLGITNQAWCKKRKGVNPFKLVDVVILRKLLNLSDEDTISIFFPEEVGK